MRPTRAAPITSKIGYDIKNNSFATASPLNAGIAGAAAGVINSTVNELTRVALVGGKLNWSSVAIGGIQGGIYGYGEGLGAQARVNAARQSSAQANDAYNRLTSLRPDGKSPWGEGYKVASNGKVVLDERNSALPKALSDGIDNALSGIAADAVNDYYALKNSTSDGANRSALYFENDQKNIAGTYDKFGAMYDAASNGNWGRFVDEFKYSPTDSVSEVIYNRVYPQPTDFQRKMEVMTGNTFGAIAYGAAKMSGASEDRANLAGAFGSGLDLLGVAATGGGMLRTKTISPAAIEGMNGNSKLSSRTTYLYELYLKDGTFLKNGVTINLDTRYTKSYMADKDIFPISSGTRTDMLNLERQRTLSNPGPYNNESWAVKVKNARGNQ